ncbi:MAG: hypothetical protein ACK57W_05395 [Flavobacteriales bacterium]
MMPAYLRNILSVIAGVVSGSVVNMGIIHYGSILIPSPNGTDLTTAEGIRAALPLLEPKHYIVPFLAHALGTLLGALLALRLSGRASTAWVLSLFFQMAGIVAVFQIPAPLWFSTADLILAYIPMGWLATRLVRKRR